MTKLYTGDNAKYLVGDQKIPEYLTKFLNNMHRQAEEFKISCCRQLRFSTEKLVELCQKIPRSVFYYLQFKFQSITENAFQLEDSKFKRAQDKDKNTKEEHLRLFRPNLENPANKEDTRILNETELKRSEDFQEVSNRNFYINCYS